jgi:EAL domain-containing protein (putative c-di-GMP-specific phosphodiesterase class I)
MPRTSYGNDKREQAWTLINHLLEARGSSKAQQVFVREVTITYGNWDMQSTEAQPYLVVKGTLSSLSNLANNALSREQIRESINEHLGNSYLSILEDHRTQKAGRGADTWKFRINLWAIDADTNRQAFLTLWEQKKSDFNHIQSLSQSKSFLSNHLETQDSDAQGSEEAFSVVELFNFLQPYEAVVDYLIASMDEYLKASASKELTEEQLKEKALEILLDISKASSVVLFSKRAIGEGWNITYGVGAGEENSAKNPLKQPVKLGVNDDREGYIKSFQSHVLPKLPEKKIFSKDSHGRIIKKGKCYYLIVPLKGNSNRPSFLCICNIKRDEVLLGEPFSDIVSTFISLDKSSLANIYDIETKILDGLKRAFDFVTTNLYQRRFALFKERLEKMTVNFQPILKLNPLVLEAWEALARDPASIKNKKASTMVAPVYLFKAAELWGVEFTTELDLYFLRKATDKYKELRTTAKLNRFHEILPLSVNVYPASLIRDAYLNEVKRITQSNIIPAERLILEISEKSNLPEMLYWSDEVMTWKLFRDRLKRFVREVPGIKFAIDDFGVGYASVARLVELNLEYVKIDRGVLEYAEDVRDKVITFVLETLIEGGNYSPHIIVEGVDKDYPISLNDLLKIGAQSIQGYIVDEPGSQIYERLNDEKFKSLQAQLA